MTVPRIAFLLAAALWASPTPEGRCQAPVRAPRPSRHAPPAALPPTRPATTPPSGDGRPATGAPYVLGPEDALAISVTNMPSMSGPAIVRPDGKIAFGLAGEIAASGKTPAQLGAELERRLAEYVRQPRVAVQVTQFRSPGFLYVMGQVANPGPYPFHPGVGAAEALALAGGPNARGDLKRVTITRTDRSPQVIDLSSLDETGKVEGNVALQPGDLVDVPMMKRLFITVLGAVKKQGRYEFQEKASIAEAVAHADGLTERADARGSTLLRNGRETPLDLDALLVRGDTHLDLPLEDGDVLTVKESTYQVYVVGEVTKGGRLQVRDQVDLLEALSLAGGPTRDANLAKAVLIHPDRTSQTIDLDRLVNKQELSKNIKLAQDDFLFIPSKKPKKSWTDYLGIAYPVDVLRRVLTGQ